MGQSVQTLSNNIIAKLVMGQSVQTLSNNIIAKLVMLSYSAQSFIS